MSTFHFPWGFWCVARFSGFDYAGVYDAMRLAYYTYISEPELNSKVKALVERTVGIVHSSIDSLRSATVLCSTFNTGGEYLYME
jgi:uncharacterized membrane protein